MNDAVELIPKEPPAEQIIKEVKARTVWRCSTCSGLIMRGEKFIKITEKRWGLKRGRGWFWTDQPVEIRCMKCHTKSSDKSLEGK